MRFGTMGDLSEADVLGALASIELTLLDLGAAPARGAGTAAAVSELTQRARALA